MPVIGQDPAQHETIARRKPVPVTVSIPPLDPLVPDESYFDAIAASPIHGGVLDAIRQDYS